jgi:hypothetical protein
MLCDRILVRHAGEVTPEPPKDISPPITGQHIVYLDPRGDRPVSQYSPEGEIRMMGDFAAGLARKNNLPRPMAWVLVAIILLPILVSVIAVVTTW